MRMRQTMGDESSSGADKIAQTNDEGAFHMDDGEGIN